MPLALVPRERPLRVVRGPLAGARWIPGSGPHGYWLGRAELAEVALLMSIVRPGHTVFDVGANVGYYTLLAARRVGPTGRVVAFEPLPANLQYLQRHLALNDCETVRLIPAAVADAPGDAMFAPRRSSSEGALSSVGTVRVAVVTLDQIVAEDPTLRPDLIKIDVEGAEALVLQGATRLLSSARPQLLLSTHTTAARLECCRILGDHHYTVRPMFGSGTVETSSELYAAPVERTRNQFD